MMRTLNALAVRYPFLGAILWISSIQYFFIQLVVAAAWPDPYSWKYNYISDLGNTECGVFNGLSVCSPLHLMMNLSFVIFGITMAIGAALIYQQLSSSKLASIGFALMVVAGLGTIVVGLFPENNPNGLHVVGAFLGLAVGNISVLMLGLASTGLGRTFRTYTILSGTVSIVAFVLFVSDSYLGLGRGGMERLVSYPFTIWMIAFGIYLVTLRIRMIAVGRL